jgi:hypothetical protein
MKIKPLHFNQNMIQRNYYRFNFNIWCKYTFYIHFYFLYTFLHAFFKYILWKDTFCIKYIIPVYIANSSWHWGSYGSIWTGPLPKKYYMDRSFWGPYNIFMVTDRSIYSHMTRSDMNYLLYYTFYLK